MLEILPREMRLKQECKKELYIQRVCVGVFQCVGVSVSVSVYALACQFFVGAFHIKFHSS